MLSSQAPCCCAGAAAVVSAGAAAARRRRARGEEPVTAGGWPDRRLHLGCHAASAQDTRCSTLLPSAFCAPAWPSCTADLVQDPSIAKWSPVQLHTSQEVTQIDLCPCHDDGMTTASLLMWHVSLSILTDRSFVCRRAAQQPPHEMVSPSAADLSTLQCAPDLHI